MTTADRSPTLWNRAFVTIFISSLLQEMSFSTMLHVPGYLTDQGASEGQIGLVYSIAALVSLGLRPLVGRLLDVQGRRFVLLIGGVANVGGILLFLSVAGFGPWMFVVRSIYIVAEIIMFTAALAYAADSIPESRRTAGLALYGLTGLIPIGVGTLLGDGILALGGFTALFWIAAGFGALSWLVIWRLPILGPPPDGSEPRRGFIVTMLQRDLVPLWILGFAFAVAVNTIFTFIRTFVDDRSIGSIGMFFGVYSAVAVLVRVFGGNLPDRVGYRRIIYPTYIGLAAGFLVLSVTTSIAMLLVAAAIGGASHGLIFPTLSSQVVARSRLRERGSALAFFTSLFDLSVLSIVPVTGALVDAFDYPTAFRFVAVVLLVGLAGYSLADRRITPTTNKPASLGSATG